VVWSSALGGPAVGVAGTFEGGDGASPGSGIVLGGLSKGIFVGFAGGGGSGGFGNTAVSGGVGGGGVGDVGGGTIFIVGAAGATAGAGGVGFGGAGGTAGGAACGGALAIPGGFAATAGGFGAIGQGLTAVGCGGLVTGDGGTVVSLGFSPVHEGLIAGLGSDNPAVGVGFGASLLDSRLIFGTVVGGELWLSSGGVTGAGFFSSRFGGFGAVIPPVFPAIISSRYWMLMRAMEGLPPLVKTYIPSVAFSISATRREKLSRASVSGTILSIGTEIIFPP